MGARKGAGYEAKISLPQSRVSWIPLIGPEGPGEWRMCSYFCVMQVTHDGKEKNSNDSMLNGLKLIEGRASGDSHVSTVRG